MSTLKKLIIAACLVLIGLDSGRVPGNETVWMLIYFAIAAGVLHTTLQPDRFKLRIVTAMMASAGLLRGISFLVEEGRLGPVAFHTLVATLAIGYWEVRKDELPERYNSEGARALRRSTAASTEYFHQRQDALPSPKPRKLSNVNPLGVQRTRQRTDYHQTASYLHRHR